MQATTLGQLLTDISARADLPVLSSATFITQAEMIRWVNQSGRRLMQMLIEAHGEGHFATTQTITASAGYASTELDASSTAAATDIFRILALRVTLDGVRVRLSRATMDEIDAEDDGADGSWSRGVVPRWAFREHGDQSILWSRAPTEAHDVTVHYVPYFVFVDHTAEPTMIDTMSDTTNHKMRSHMGWDEWVVLDCAIKAIKRQGLPPDEWQSLMVEQQELQRGIVNVSRRRTDEVQHVKRRWRGGRRGRHDG